MIYSGAPFTITSFDAFDVIDLSTEALIFGLLANPDRPRYLMLHVQPYNPLTMTPIDRYYGGSGLTRVPGIDVLFQPRLIDAFNVQVNLFSGPFEIGGAAQPTFGAISIAIGDEVETISIFRDDFAWLDWHRRLIELYLGGHPDDGWEWVDYVKVFKGVSAETTWTEDKLTFVIRDPGEEIDQPIQEHLYLGDDSNYEGGVDLKGKRKPLAYGRPRNVSPIQISRLHLLYQVHDGPIFSVQPYDKGDGYFYLGDTTDLYGWTPSLPTERTGYKTDLSRGCFKLGGTPLGALTADVVGENDGGVLHEMQGDLIYHILKSKAGFTDADFDLGSFGFFDTPQREVALYLDGNETIASVLDTILAPSGFRTFDALGRLVIGRIEFTSPIMVLQPPRIVSIQRIRTPHAMWRLKLSYARNFTPMRDEDFAALFANPIHLDKDFAINEFRDVVVEDTTVRDNDKTSDEKEVETALIHAADAIDEVNRAMSLFKVRRDLYEVSASRIDFRLRAGQTVTVKFPRFGLHDGRDFIVVGIGTNSTTGLTSLSLWG